MKSKAILNVLYLLAGVGMDSAGRRRGAERLAAANGWFLRPLLYSVDGDGECRIHHSSGDFSVSAASKMWPREGAVTGVIVEGDARKVPLRPSQFGRLPTVFIAPKTPPRGKGRSSVVRDESAIGALAARGLLVSGYNDYAFVPLPGSPPWSRRREAGFEEAVHAAGRGFYHFAVPRGVSAVEELEPPLATWLAALPKPVGIFAANDAVGRAVLRACRSLGIAVPDEVAVVGVDNRKDFCELTTPTLSSISQDFEEEGDAAMRLLASMIESPERTFAPVVCRSARFVHRASTRFEARGDARIARGLEFIRLKACDGIAPKDVAKAMFVSLPLAKRLFRRNAGRTILSEIHAVRLDRAREMLAGGIQPDIVAQECGYGSVNDFRRVFRHRLGTTIGKWLKGRRCASKA